MSLDGFIARPDGALDWLERVARPPEDYGYAAFAASVDAMVLGSATYEAVLRFPEWPYATKQHVVVLTSKPRPSLHGERFDRGALREVLKRLADVGSTHAYLDGGVVISEAASQGLLDQLTVSIIPVVLGRGIALFKRLSADLALELVESRSFPSGLVQVRYAFPQSTT